MSRLVFLGLLGAVIWLVYQKNTGGAGSPAPRWYNRFTGYAFSQ